MVIIIATAVPPGLRGHVTRWMFELAPGVFAGHVSARVRDELWDRVCEYAGPGGKALMVYSARNEQRMAFRQHHYAWEPVDFDGLTIMGRPVPAPPVTRQTAPTPRSRASRSGWAGVRSFPRAEGTCNN